MTPVYKDFTWRDGETGEPITGEDKDYIYERGKRKEKLVRVGVQEMSYLEPETVETNLDEFIEEFARWHNFRPFKSRDWKIARRFYLLLWNAGYISAMRKVNGE